MDPSFYYEINRSYELSLPTYICDNELIKLWVCCIWQRIKCWFIILLWNRPFLLNYATTNWYGSYSDEPSLWAQIAIWQWIKYGSIILLLNRSYGHVSPCLIVLSYLNMRQGIHIVVIRIMDPSFYHGIEAMDIWGHV